MYKKLINSDGIESGAVVKANEDGSLTSIPPVADNTDYQAFLKYQAEGGKVYGADEDTQ
jgi:hypothetical protein